MLPALRILACQARAGLARTSAMTICSNSAAKDIIDGLVKKDRLVVFMKGTPDNPRCGFSNAVVQILDYHGVKNYDSHDVLSDEHLRQGIKDYTHWPTIPQVFIGGEFIGGCDIMLDMHRNGELIEELKRVGIRSKLLTEEQKAG